jgi:hypothetical protein
MTKNQQMHINTLYFLCMHFCISKTEENVIFYFFTFFFFFFFFGNLPLLKKKKFIDTDL